MTSEADCYAVVIQMCHLIVSHVWQCSRSGGSPVGRCLSIRSLHLGQPGRPSSLFQDYLRVIYVEISRAHGCRTGSEKYEEALWDDK